jgi:hypothetical protein
VSVRKARQRREARHLAGMQQELRTEALRARNKVRAHSGLFVDPTGVYPASKLIDYASFLDYIAEHGRIYVNRPTPEGVELGTDGICFTNAQRLALARFDLQYVEGMATEPGGPGYAAGWAEHAWCADADGNAVEVTWPYWPERRYLGVPLPTPIWGAFDAQTGLVPSVLFGQLERGDR